MKHLQVSLTMEQHVHSSNQSQVKSLDPQASSSKQIKLIIQGNVVSHVSDYLQSPMGNQWPNKNSKHSHGEGLSCKTLKHAFHRDIIRTLKFYVSFKVSLLLLLGTNSSSLTDVTLFSRDGCF